MPSSLKHLHLEPARDAQTLYALHSAVTNTPWNIAAYSEILENDINQTLIAYSHDTAIGFILYRAIEDECEILQLAVSPRFQRRGVASALVDAMLNKYSRCTLDVDVENSAAIALYQQLGFAQESIRKHYYDNGNDAIIMSRAL